MNQNSTGSYDLEDTLELDLEDIKFAPTTIEPAEDDLPDSTPTNQLDTALANVSYLAQENENLKNECARLRRKDQAAKKLNKLIKPMAERSFIFMCVYSGTVGSILLLDGFKYVPFELEGSTLNFLVGSTASTVIGLVGMVLGGIFLNARK